MQASRCAFLFLTLNHLDRHEACSRQMLFFTMPRLDESCIFHDTLLNDSMLDAMFSLKIGLDQSLHLHSQSHSQWQLPPETPDR
jgi:hypothetical protein